MGRASVPTPALYPAFFFVLEKAVKSAGNAVIPTFPAHCPHGLQHLRHKRPTFAFTSESGYTLGFRRRIAHKGSHAETVAFPPSATARSCAASEIATGRIAGESGCTPYGVCPLPPASWPRGAAGSFSLLPKLRLVHPALRAFRMCETRGGIITLGAFRTFTNIPGPGVRTANFAAFGSWPGVRSRRTQRACGAAMRLCASLLRGVAAPLGRVICLQLGDVTVFSLCAQYFLNVRGGGGITTPGVLCVLPKRRTAACQSG